MSTTTTHVLWSLDLDTGTWVEVQRGDPRTLARVRGQRESAARRAEVACRYDVTPVGAQPDPVPTDGLPAPVTAADAGGRRMDAERPHDRAFTDATNLIDYLRTHPGQWVPFAPGDQPSMLVALVQLTPHPALEGHNHGETLLIVSDTTGTHMVLTQAPVTTWCSDEAADHARQAANPLWTPEHWVRAHGGRYLDRYAFVRPLLAALGWAPGEPTYQPRDTDRVKLVLADLGSLGRAGAII